GFLQMALRNQKLADAIVETAFGGWRRQRCDGGNGCHGFPSDLSRTLAPDCELFHIPGRAGSSEAAHTKTAAPPAAAPPSHVHSAGTPASRAVRIASPGEVQTAVSGRGSPSRRT